jgi:uncharacterized membrane protein YkoI
MSEKAAVVKIDSDGELVECAKGLDASECGYKAGAKVCGKCGAMATSMKAMAEMGESAPKRKRSGMAAAEAVDEYVDSEIDEKVMTDDEDVIDEEDAEEIYAQQQAPQKKKKMKMQAASMEEMDDEDMEDEDMEDEDMEDMEDVEEEDAPMMAPRKRSIPMEESYEEAADMENEKMFGTAQDNRNAMRKRRMESMGFKSADFDEEAYVCAFDRKVYPGGANVCDSCPGGCVSEKGMPALIEIEGMAEDMFRGKVLDSGYSDEADLFVVDVERKDGKPVEVFFDGSTGEVMGWHVLSNDVIEVKSALQDKVLISFTEAADIAVKSVEGDIVAVEPDVFEGFDVYAVEIDGINGKSYDVFVSLDGEVLGYDEYTQEEASEIEAEAAEIALKRAYSEETRMQLAKHGHALADGSFPIKDEADLRNAIQAFGRAKNPAEAKAHIMKRAVDLGLEDLIPTKWAGPESQEKSAATVEAATEGSEESDFLSNLMEFQMLSVEEELNQLDSE